MCVCVCVCVCVYHVFVCSSVDEHLGCFPSLAIVLFLSLALLLCYIGVHVSFQISVFIFFSDRYPGVELLGLKKKELLGLVVVMFLVL